MDRGTSMVGSTNKSALVKWVTLWTCACTSAALLLPWPAAAAVGAVSVSGSRFEDALNHNIPDLTITGAPQPASFQQVYEETGGLKRWGYATSEVLEEETGNLAQYYQRGVLDWHASPTCGTSHCMERRLTWDYFGGGAGGSRDQGVESNLFSSAQGLPFPKPLYFGHVVSDTSVDNQSIGFRGFFERLRGIGAFGVPKTEARYDDDPRTSVHVQEVESAAYQKHFIRQYFQSAVMEYHPENSNNPDELIQLRLLGDDLRDLTYPGGAWKAFRSFRDAVPLDPADGYEVERVVPGPRRVEGRLAAVTPITERCSATSWSAGQPFCARQANFESVPVGTDLLTGDVVRVRNASPEFAVGVIEDQFAGGVIHAVSVLSTGAATALNAAGSGLEVIVGLVGELGLPGGMSEVTTDDAVVTSNTTLFLVEVRRLPSGTSTTIKMVKGSANVRSKGTALSRPIAATGSTAQQAIVERGKAPTIMPRGPLSSDEQAIVDVLEQIEAQGRLGKPSSPLPPLRTLIVAHSGTGSVTSSPGGIDCGPTCAARFLQGTRVVLTATPGPQESMGGWRMGNARICLPGPNQPPPTTCTVVMDGDQTVTATFATPIP